MTTNRVRGTQELRRSNAAGKHAQGVRRERTRTDAKRNAIRDQREGKR